MIAEHYQFEAADKVIVSRVVFSFVSVTVPMYSLVYLAVLCCLATAAVENANSSDSHSVQITDHSIATVNDDPRFAFSAIITAIKVGSQAVDGITSVLKNLDLDDPKKLTDSFAKFIESFFNIFKQLSSAFGPSEDTLLLQQMQQQLTDLSRKLDALHDKMNTIVDGVALLFFRNDMNTLKSVLSTLYFAYELHVQAVDTPFNDNYTTNVNYYLRNLQDNCIKNDPITAFQKVYLDLKSNQMQDSFISGTNWKIADITEMAQDLFYTVFSYTSIQNTCLGVKVGVTEAEVNKTLASTEAAFNYFVTTFDQIQQKLRTDFFKTDRLANEVSQLVKDPRRSNEDTADDIYKFLDSKYSFNSWLVHVYDNSDSPDRHYIADKIVTEFGHLLLSNVQKKNILIVWSDNSIPLSTECPTSNVIKQLDCESGKAKDCTSALATALTDTCGGGYTSVLYFSSKLNGCFHYEANKYAVGTLPKWIGAATNFKNDPSASIPPLEATGKSSKVMVTSNAPSSVLKLTNLWPLITFLLFSLTIFTNL